MIEYQNLTLIGTSHISPESVKQVRKVIKEIEPGFVALELDPGRLKSLLEKNKRKLKFKDVRRMGVKVFLFALFGAWVEEKLGKMVKTKPGSEMKAAIFSAARIKAKVVLIDQEITITINKLFKTLTWKEKFRFLWDIVSSPFSKRYRVKFDLRAVPSEELIQNMLGQVKGRYPSFYKVLITDRNKFMARRLHKLMNKYPEDKIVAIVGAGHEKAIVEILNKANAS